MGRKTEPHPMQPLYRDNNGTVRFKRNKIVEFLLDYGGYDMNALARMTFPREDREQFAQLIGYSARGFGELSYTSAENRELAARRAARVLKKKRAIKRRVTI